MSRINLTDDADTIATKIRKARTDPDPLPDTVTALATRPEAANLVNIYAALADSTPDAVVNEFAGQQFATFKPRLADLAVEHLAPITTRMAEFMADPARIDRILGEGADRAAATVTEVYDDGTVGRSPHPKTGENDVESNAAVDRPVPAGVRNSDQAVEGPGE
jgi:tryptophanyl-tRNA synthetase